MARTTPIRVQVEGLPEVKAHIESLVAELNEVRRLASRAADRIAELEAERDCYRNAIERHKADTTAQMDATNEDEAEFQRQTGDERELWTLERWADPHELRLWAALGEVTPRATTVT